MRPYYLPQRYGRKWKKTELRPCGLLIYTAANNEKAECGRTTRLNDTVANEKRQSCGRAERTTLSVILFAKTEKEPKRFFKKEG